MISVIIVNYNTKELLKNCINSIERNTEDVDYEIIISDNGSEDGSVEMLKEEFPNVILIENKMNIGFGAANNRGVEIAHGEYLLLLNSDTLLLNNALLEFYKVAKDSDTTIYGSFLYDKNGNIINSYGTFLKPFKWIILSYIYNFWPPVLNVRKKTIRIDNKDDKIVDFITGADLFISKKAFKEINGFDESYFMYCEDEDLCRRAKKIEYVCKIINSPKIIHLEGASSRIKIQKIIIKNNSTFYYISKWEYFPLLYYYLYITFMPLSLLSPYICLKDKMNLIKNVSLIKKMLKENNKHKNLFINIH